MGVRLLKTVDNISSLYLLCVCIIKYNKRKFLTKPFENQIIYDVIMAFKDNIGHIIFLLCRLLSSVKIKSFSKKSKHLLLGFNENCQRRSTLVRFIGSHCIWIPVSRSIFLWRCHSIESERGFNELRVIVIKLESEIQELRTVVDRLLLDPESKTATIGKCSEQTELLEDKVVTSQAKIPASPVRPPPAPPLPPSPVVPTRCLIVKVKPRMEWKRDNSFLEELSKRPPKLRHVELSPGGRPKRIRRSSASNDPRGGLSFILKKRYIALHNSPRLSIDHCKSSPNTSFS